MQVIFSKIELEISPFLTVIQFYRNIGKKGVGKSPQEISVRTTFRNTLTNLIEYPLDMVSKHGFWYPYLPDYISGCKICGKLFCQVCYLRVIVDKGEVSELS